jgi:hypothetical protein
METMRRDKIRIVTSSYSDEILIHPRTKRPVKKALRNVQVSGCAYPEINGRYVECGMMNDAMRYKNVNGWTVCRNVMQEIPELGIFADNCYTTTKETSMLGTMTKRAGDLLCLI